MSEDNAVGYLERQISALEDVAERETQYPHNEEEFAKRPIFFRLQSKVKDFLKGNYNQDIIMPGLRGVGKTVLCYQIYNRFKNNFDDEKIIYISCDYLTGPVNSSLEEALEMYEKRILGKRVEDLDSKILIMIDEAHYQDNWDQIVKSFSDRNPSNILFLVTGSASLPLEVSADLSRRISLERLFPLRFYEYELLTSARETPKDLLLPPTDNARNLTKACFKKFSTPDDRKKSIDNICSNLRSEYFPQTGSDIEIEIEKYLTRGGFPFCLMSSQDKVYEETLSIAKKVAERDIIETSDLSIKSAKKGTAILKYLSDSEQTSANNIAQRIENIKGKTVARILDAFTQAGVLHKAKAAGEVKHVQNKPNKYYFSSPTLQSSLLWITGNFDKKNETLGSLLETAVADILFRKSHTHQSLINNIFYDYRDGGADFVVNTTDQRRCAIEVGWGDKSSKGINQVSNTLEETNCQYGIVVSSAGEDLRYDDSSGKPIYVIPKEVFLVQ